ncbi:hypothetical protein [Emticicia sp. C21]|uniref:hypothetical protein n=1 Tax=Emticicia sp. C21 TaxID=2302915 RepID=UPI000E3485E5|nr:hypothetical protein [Emticicia sp. C21]RFS13317.1 hypothetical protein D0T08_27130 [Emticicia sp. C21]
MKKILFFSLIICHLNSFGQSIELGEIANKNGNILKYVAVGSTLSAGVRNGGVYADAQLTSFPALLSKQMGIANFNQALLEGNETGHKTVLFSDTDFSLFQGTG